MAREWLCVCFPIYDPVIPYGLRDLLQLWKGSCVWVLTTGRRYSRTLFLLETKSLDYRFLYCNKAQLVICCTGSDSAWTVIWIALHLLQLCYHRKINCWFHCSFSLSLTRSFLLSVFILCLFSLRWIENDRPDLWAEWQLRWHWVVSSGGAVLVAKVTFLWSHSISISMWIHSLKAEFSVTTT